MSKTNLARSPRNRILPLLGVLGVLAFIVNSAIGIHRLFTSTGLPSPMATFTSEALNFTFQYPETWSASELPQGNHGDMEVVAFAGHPGFYNTPSLLIARRSFDRPVLEDVVAWGEERLIARNSPYVMVQMGELSGPKEGPLQRRYSLLVATLLGQKTKICMDWYTLAEHVGYQLAFCVDEHYWQEVEPVFKQMANSFRADQ